MTDVTPPPTPPTTPLWEDFVDIFINPREVFARRAEDPVVFLPLIVVTVVVGLILFGTKDLMEPIFNAEFARGMAAAQRQNPNMTPAQMEMARKIGGAAATFGGFVGTPIAICMIGLVTFLCGKVVKATTTLGQAMMVGAYASVPKIIGSIVAVVFAAVMDQGALTGVASVTLGPARFLDPASTPMTTMVLLGRLELFTLWSTVLIGVGLKVTGKLDTTKAALGAALVWLAASIVPLLQALRAG